MGLTNTQYDTIMRDYQRQQAKDHQELAARQQEIYGKFPEFPEIDRQIASASTACARQLLSDRPSKKDAVKALKQSIAALSRRRSEILTSAGYPADYLQMTYRCPDCQDTGYIGPKKCHCFRQATLDLLYAQSNLKELLKEEAFSSFSLDYYSAKQIDPVTGLSARDCARRAFTECRRFVQDFDYSFENVFLYGNTGLGKTFLSHCIARELIESAHSVIYFSAFFRRPRKRASAAYF